MPNSKQCKPIVVAMISLMMIVSSRGHAGEDKQQSAPPKVLADLFACRQILDPQSRLNCFDRQAGALAGANERREILIADKDEVERTRKGLFGFSLPASPLLDSDRDRVEMRELETTVDSARRSRQGGWIIKMIEGGTWEQIDLKELALSPKPGQKIVITKGALGSYFIRVDGQPAIKMRRIQ